MLCVASSLLISADMKTTMLISCALVGALAACSHKTTAPPQSPDTATNTNTTVTTAYSNPPPIEPMQQPAIDNTLNNPDTTTGSVATTGMGDGDQASNAGRTMNNAPANGSSTPSAINEPQANAKPVQPSQDSAPTRAKSATDQGESKAEVKTTASIRKRMMASKSLSFGAKNIKVITQGTSVTLIGNVKSDAEKNEIEGLARNTDGVTNVDDQLIVKQ